MPPLKRRETRLHSRAVAGALSLLAVAAIAGCGSSSSSNSGSTPTRLLNTKRVELAIKDSIRLKRHLHATVRCPAGVVQQKGLTFHCTASTKSGKSRLKTIFTVSQTNGAGGVYYASPQ
jgi:hypothetical protein